MVLDERIEAFSELGAFLRQFRTTGSKHIKDAPLSQKFFDEMMGKIQYAKHHNGWFTEENILFSMHQWSNALTKGGLKEWLAPYKLQQHAPKTIGIVMAGNIPLVGFHDFLSVLITGNNVLIKQSSNDNFLLPYIADCLIAIEPRFKDRITFSTEKLVNFDAVIATGSDNTARYFEYYFDKVPNIIRKSRNSIAILTGNESTEQLNALGEDVFRYYGLGCRSVSKLMVPKDYNFDAFFKAIYSYNEIINGAKYANNYDYNKAVYLMSNYKLLENGFLMLKEDASYSSPIATLFYETYDSLENVREKLEVDKDKIQCVVSSGLFDNNINFGQTQSPNLSDYADGIDIIEFLSKIS